MSRRTLVVDFDGTITERDLLQEIAVRFGDPSVVHDVDRALHEGRISLREEITREYEPVRAPLDEVVSWVLDQVRVRAGFAELVLLCRERGWRLVVVSSGFHELIEPVLRREGVDVELHANRVDARPDGWRVEWRYGAACETCGQSCKRETVAALANGSEIVYVGDGYSDRCAAEEAQVVFARSGLARWLEERRVPHERFDDFFDVAGRLS